MINIEKYNGHDIVLNPQTGMFICEDLRLANKTLEGLRSEMSETTFIVFCNDIKHMTPEPDSYLAIQVKARVIKMAEGHFNVYSLNGNYIASKVYKNNVHNRNYIKILETNAREIKALQKANADILSQLEEIE